MARPFLRTLDRMQEQSQLAKEALLERVRDLLDRRLKGDPGPVEAVFVPAPLGLMSEHTHFFNGFSLHLLLPVGVAVALRRTSGRERICIDGTDEIYVIGERAVAELPARVRLVHEALSGFCPECRFDASVCWSLPESCTDAYAAALTVAAGRATNLLSGTRSPEDSVGMATAAVERALNRPFSIAYALAANVGTEDQFALVDVETREHLPLDAPSRDVLGWGCITAPWIPPPDAGEVRKRLTNTEKALATLHQKGFSDTETFRELEHRDLQRALDAAPARFRPLVRFLVGENRRVQKIVAAVQRKDWQMFGALLLMSHNARRAELDTTSPEADLCVHVAERMTADGIYGATMTGSAGCVFVAGQPFVVPGCLDRIQAEMRTRLGGEPTAFLI